MWTCNQCSEQIEDTFDSCWKCGTAKGDRPAAPVTPPSPEPKWRLAYRVFRGTWASWDELFAQAADFANTLGPERVISISHSEDKDDGVVAVWYWTTEA